MWRIWVLALILGLAGCREPLPAAFRNTDISGADFGPALAGLRDQQGRPGTLANYHDKAVIVVFGYTSCPDVCPTTLARLAETLKTLGEDAHRVQVLLVTVDPERDTPEKLDAYVKAFNPAFVGLSGDMTATEAVTREFKAYFARSQAGASANMTQEHHHEHATDAYTVDHSAGIYAFDPAGRVRLYIKDDASVEAIANDLRLLLAAA